jgi:glutathione S-transferase
MDRMAACGHGQPEKLSAAEALQIAHASSPLAVSQEVFQDEHEIPLGSQVTITAESFGLESTPGTLVAATRTRYTLARSDERAGELHIHFPRVGYVLQKIEK